VGGYNYIRGQKSRGKEFTEINSLGIHAYEFPCEDKNCQAKLLVPMKNGGSEGLTAVRSKAFHNHIPEMNCTKVGQLFVLIILII